MTSKAYNTTADAVTQPAIKPVLSNKLAALAKRDGWTDAARREFTEMAAAAKELENLINLAVHLDKAAALTRPRTRAYPVSSYREAIAWIACNDEPLCDSMAEMHDMISVCLVADVFGVTRDEVVFNVMRVRFPRVDK